MLQRMSSGVEPVPVSGGAGGGGSAHRSVSGDSRSSVRAVKADFIELALHVPVDLEGASLPPSFELAVLALYREETISSVRAAQLLQGNLRGTGSS
jgi:hypothetical protein